MHATAKRASGRSSYLPPCELSSLDTNFDQFSGPAFSVHHSAGRSSAQTTTEIAFDDPRIAFQTGRVVRQDHPTGFDDITAFGQRKGDTRVLLDEKDRHARTPKCKDCFDHLLNDTWGEP